jgi:2-keto-4-pentenoate hydratase/2-oxohepta-3-ene-1,7-dioic acid hydratase in catechol pathway
MKLAFFDNYKLGVVVGDKIVDVSAVTKGIKALGPQDVIRGVIEKWSAYKGKLAAAAKKGKGKPLAKVKLRPPLPKPENIICMAVNYMEDGTLPEPAPINAFMKSPSAVIGDGDTMVLPDMAASVFEGEAEIAVVIGKRASKVTAADAMKYVFGYTNFIDGSARGVVPPTNVFYQMKSRDTFAPIGPYIVTADEIKDPHKLQIRLWNNGQLMQNFNTDDMGHKIPRCIEWLTAIHTLEPGDVIASGTNHRGLNPFMDGDKVELETEGLGRLTFMIKDELKRKWERRTRLQMHEAAAQKTPGAYPDFTPQTAGKYAK